MLDAFAPCQILLGSHRPRPIGEELHQPTERRRGACSSGQSQRGRRRDSFTSTMSARTFETWSHAEVCFWLRTSGFANLTDKFSELNLVGSDLKWIDDHFLQAKVGVRDAKQRTDVLAAVDALLASAGCKRNSGSPNSHVGVAPQQQPSKSGSLQRMQTVPSNLGTSVGRHIVEEKGPRSPNALHSSTKRPSLQHISAAGPAGKSSTMPSGSQPPRGVSAQQLMADGTMDCCGWIRKQGGSVRTCKSPCCQDTS